MASTKVVSTEPVLNEAQLTDIRSFEDAVAMLAQAGIETHSITDLGDGFAVMDKSEFVNRRFVIVSTRLVDAEKSDFGNPFAIIRLVTADGIKAIITDGSHKSGVCNQVLVSAERGINLAGYVCEKGLLGSEYKYVDETGKETPAVTYYFAGM